MEKSLLNSAIIMKLKEQIQQGNKEALEVFWHKVESNNGPFIEKIDGDLENDLVTFVYKADEEIENVVFMPPGGWNNLFENKMERLLETNLWYINYKVRNNVRFIYSFSVNDSFDVECEKRWDRLIYDQFNKNRVVFKGQNGEKDEIQSYLVMPNADKHIWVEERNNISKGTMYEHQFYSENLEKCRRIRIYTPYGYKEDAKPYGFLVLTDGNEYINILSAVTVLDNLI